MQIAGFNSKEPEKITAWVVDLLRIEDRSALSQNEGLVQDSEEYNRLILVVLEKIIGGVSATKIGLGLINDVRNMKEAINYPENKKIVSLGSKFI